MKYQCDKCNFHWVGTSFTFDEVREHEKTHKKERTKKKSSLSVMNRT